MNWPITAGSCMEIIYCRSPSKKKRRVMEWEALGLERMLDSEEAQQGFNVDSGGGGGYCQYLQSWVG